jgi:hypothetical protein
VQDGDGFRNEIPGRAPKKSKPLGEFRAMTNRPNRIADAATTWLLRLRRGGSRGSALPAPSAIAAAVAALLVVVAVNGRPTVFPDTDDYYMVGAGVIDAGGKFLFHGQPLFDPSNAHDYLAYDNRGDEEPIHNQDGARSAYYGLFLYGLTNLGTTWAMAAAQGALLAALAFVFFRAAAPSARLSVFVAMMAALAVATPLALVVGFAMPDVFAGATILAMTSLLVYGDRLSAGTTIFVWGALCFALNAHPSHVLVAVAMLVFGAPALLAFGVPRRPLMRRTGLVAGAVAAAVSANAAYGLVARLRTGDALRSPPFVAVRLLADGPGRAYLRSHCGRGLHLKLCDYRSLPLDDSNKMLWSDDAGEGIFNAADFETRVRIEKEEPSFVLGVLGFDPIGVVASAFRNWGEQIADINVEELIADQGGYLADSYWRTTNLPKLILGAGPPCGPHFDKCKSRLPEPLLRFVHWTATFAALGYLALWFHRRRAAAMREPDADAARLTAALALLVLGVALNAGVCGAISGAFGRYQARVVWLLPLGAMIAAAGARAAKPLRARAAAFAPS